MNSPAHNTVVVSDSGLVEFRLPDVGEGIAEAELLDWFVEVGAAVEADGLLCQVQTDKSIVEIPAPASGTLLKRCASVGDLVKVGALLVVIGDAGALDPREPDSRSTGGEPVGEEFDSGAAAAFDAPLNGSSLSTPSTPRRRPLASPRTRRLAARRGIDLSGIVGTGPHGRILEADLDHPQPAGSDAAPALLAESTAPGADASRAGSNPGRRRRAESRTDETIELRGLRRSIARSMTEALTIPHVTEFREVDATNLLAARAALKPTFEARGSRLSVFPLLLKSVMHALALQPSMNATYDASTETLTKHAGVHLGMATATEDGLIVPVVHDADLMSLSELTEEVERLAQRARTRTATQDELTGGSFTVTNFGSFGTWMGNPVIRPPEVGIAGFGRITEKVVALDGQPAVRPVLPIVVATDHRINDGAHLAEFVNALTEAVAQPLLLLS
ncbi:MULTISPECIES: dihydrolipoamide acetyltransferase family protein [unclassified Nocardioides]|uniref:dihydrolipoamide acetyltransferase family protein n=1 Tax=unclassified Nocardioides TaxID=2615069 RepID=UPI0036149EBD